MVDINIKHYIISKYLNRYINRHNIVSSIQNKQNLFKGMRNIGMQKAIHICIISCQHDTDDKRVTHKIALSFIENGFKVTWLGPCSEQNNNKYNINYLCYVRERRKISRFLHYRKAKKLLQSIRGVDIYFAVEPDSAALAIKMASKNKAKAIFDIHEVYHMEMLEGWIKVPWLRKIIGILVRKKIENICSKVDLVVAVSNEVMKPYRKVDVDKIIIRNLVTRSFVSEINKTIQKKSKQGFVLMHGKNTEMHGTSVVLEAIQKAAKDIEVKVLMFNKLSSSRNIEDNESFIRIINNKRLQNNIVLRKYVPFSEMPAILAECNAGIIAYNRTWGVRSLPNRLFEYMAAGLPVIAPDYAIEISKIIKKEKCGILVDTEDPAAISNAIRYLWSHEKDAEEMGIRGYEAFLKKYNWDIEIKPLITKIEKWF